jgi:hypothetical protein
MKKIKLIILITIFYCGSLLSLEAADTGSNEIIPTTHKLGIGTTSPSRNLHVNGTSLFTNNGNFLNKLGLGLNSPNEKLSVNGTVSFKEGSAPSISAGYGKLYTSTNSKLYFADDEGNSYNLTNGSSIAPGNYLRSDTSTSYTSGTITFDAGTTMDLNSTSLSIADTDIALDGTTTTFSQTGSTGTITMKPKKAANFIVNQNGAGLTRITNETNDAILSINAKNAYINTGGLQFECMPMEGLECSKQVDAMIKFQANGSDMYSMSFVSNGNLLKIGDQGGASTNRLVMDTNGNVSIGMPLANAKFTVNGVVSVAETSAPSGSSGYGKLYALSTDKELYYLASDQSAVKITNNGSLASGGGAGSIDGLSDGKTSSNSVFLGSGAGDSYDGNTRDATAVGIDALKNNLLGNANSAFGFQALKSNTNGDHNTGLGNNSMNANTTGIYNTAVGSHSLVGNTTGQENTAAGAYSLFNSIGSGNSGYGSSSLFNNTSGNGNTAVGTASQYSITTGFFNTAVGNRTMFNVDNGSSNNTAVGYKAGFGTSSNQLSNGTFLGYMSGNGLTTGDNNILIGFKAGDNITSGSTNLILGYDNDAPSAILSNQIDIADTIYGDSVSRNVGIGVNNATSKLAVNGDIILKEVNSSTAPSGFGKLFVKSADKELYFDSDDFTEIKLTNNGSLASGSGSSEWTETSLILHPADNSGAQSVVVGGTSIGSADIILHKNGSAVFNEQGLAGSDFRVESDSNQYMILADSTNNRVGIGQSNPDTVLDINGPVTVRALNNSSSGTAPNFIAFTSNGNGVGTASLTINKPSNTVENNLMVAVINIVSTNQTVTAPTGWSEINNKTASDHRSYVFYKVVGNNEASSYAFNFSGNVSSRGVILTYANGDIFSPIGAQDGITGTTGGGALYTPSVTSTKNNSTILRIGTYEDSDDTISFDNGETSRANVNYIGATGDSIRIFDKVQASAGVTGTSTDTGDSAPPSPYTGFTLAINPNASNSDPAGPDNNSAVYWLANDSGVGDNGDLLVRIRSNNTTKTFTLVDFNNDPGDQTYNGLTLNDLTANRIVRTNGSKNLASETNIFSDTNTGNVGIGQASPSNFKLELNGGNLGPSKTSTINLGSSSKRFNSVYAKENIFDTNGGIQWGTNKSKSLKTYYSNALVNATTPKTLTDMNGDSFSISKTYKVTAHNQDVSSSTGAISYFIGNGNSGFTLIDTVETGTGTDHIDLYLDSNTPKVKLHSGATLRNLQLLIEESPTYGSTSNAFGPIQDLSSPTAGTITFRGRGIGSSTVFRIISRDDNLFSETLYGNTNPSGSGIEKWGIGSLGDTHASGSNRFYIYQYKDKNDSNVQRFRMLVSDNGNFHFNLMGSGVNDNNGRYVFNGVTAFKETTTPSSSTGFGKIFANSGDKELYYVSGDNTTIKITNNGSLASVDNIMAIDDLTDAITTSTNIYLGENSGASTPGNNYETALGINALKSSTGADNTAIGYLTLNGNTTGYSNTAIGKWSLYANNTGFWNTAGGASALYSNTSGIYNSGFGTSALYANTTGGGNSAFGPKALFGNTTGIYNTATGIHALENITTGKYNSGLGGFALRYADNGSSNNTALGFNAGEGTSGSDFSNGTFLGYLTGNGLTIGDNNILIGFKAGDAMTSGSRNIVIGNDIDAPSNTNSNQLSIGNLIYGTGLDGTGTTLSSGNIGIGTASIDTKLEVNGAMMANTMVNKSFYTVASATNVTVNWNNGNKQKILLETNPVNFTFTAPSAGVGSFSLVLKQDGGGSKTVTWPASVKWPGGTAPTLSTAPNKLDIVTCIYDGTDYFCQIGIDFF